MNTRIHAVLLALVHCAAAPAFSASARSVSTPRRPAQAAALPIPAVGDSAIAKAVAPAGRGDAGQGAAPAQSAAALQDQARSLGGRMAAVAAGGVAAMAKVLVDVDNDPPNPYGLSRERLTHLRVQGERADLRKFERQVDDIRDRGPKSLSHVAIHTVERGDGFVVIQLAGSKNAVGSIVSRARELAGKRPKGHRKIDFRLWKALDSSQRRNVVIWTPGLILQEAYGVLLPTDFAALRRHLKTMGVRTRGYGTYLAVYGIPGNLLRRIASRRDVGSIDLNP